MLISDWSSDVCSSDLRVMPLRVEQGTPGQHAFHVAMFVDDRIAPMLGIGRFYAQPTPYFGQRLGRLQGRHIARTHRAHAYPLQVIGEIGSASCTARGCLYV